MHARFLTLTLVAAAMLLAAAPLSAAEPPPRAGKPAAAPEPEAKPDAPAPGDIPGWMEKHKAHVARAAIGNIDLLFLGDSIMEGWAIGGKHGHGARGRRIFEACFQPVNGVNFGTRGDKTQQILYRIAHGELDGIRPKAIMLMVGSNNLPPNTPEETYSGIAACVAALREKQPEAKILLMGLLPRGTLAREPIRAQIIQVNERLAKLEDGQHVFFMDLGPKLLTEEGKFTEEMTDDGIHINPKAYQIWAEAITPRFEEWLGRPIDRYTPPGKPGAKRPATATSKPAGK